jgi:hypothetical protein
MAPSGFKTGNKRDLSKLSKGKSKIKRMKRLITKRTKE